MTCCICKDISQRPYDIQYDKDTNTYTIYLDYAGYLKTKYTNIEGNPLYASPHVAIDFSNIEGIAFLNNQTPLKGSDSQLCCNPLVDFDDTAAFSASINGEKVKYVFKFAWTFMM